MPAPFAVPQLVPLLPEMNRASRALVRFGFAAGDGLRALAGTPASVLPRSRRVDAAAAIALAPTVRRDGLDGALLPYDGQLIDDARLVTAVARTAAQHGARILTRVDASAASGTSVTLTDTLSGEMLEVSARAVVNATGVWAGQVDTSLRLRPSRGTHLVLRESSVPGLRASVYAPVPWETNRFVLVLPQPDGTAYVGLTDEPADGPVPDVPEPTEPEIGFLLDVVSAAFEKPLHRSDVVGAYAGLRPLLDAGPAPDGQQSTADISRKHATLVSRSGVVTIVGGKLTTYRRMAEDAVDAALAHAGLDAGPCRTRTLPLLGAASRARLAALELPPRLVRRYGTEAELVLDSARSVSGLGDVELLAPVADGVPVTLAELLFGVTHEGAVDVEDLLDRRTRVGLVPADRALAVPAAERALEIAARAAMS